MTGRWALQLVVLFISLCIAVQTVAASTTTVYRHTQQQGGAGNDGDMDARKWYRNARSHVEKMLRGQGAASDAAVVEGPEYQRVVDMLVKDLHHEEFGSRVDDGDDDSVASSSLLQAQDKCPAVHTDRRIPCGSWWKYTNKDDCHRRKCCWGPSVHTVNWCFSPVELPAPVHTVHVVQGCHLDVGFLKTATEIVNLWFDHHFPLAYKIGKALEERAAGGNSTTTPTTASKKHKGSIHPALKFTAQSWLVSMYVSCPPNQGLHCPNATAIAQFKEAVAKNWITWHAFPFNGEPEVADVSMIEYGYSMTHRLDAMFGKTPKMTMSQRDVPGMTRSMVPLMQRHNISYLSVGVNGGSNPPNTPHAFIWHDVATNTSIRVMYLQGGYSGEPVHLTHRYDVTVLPGGVAMVVVWRGDNAGPPTSVDEVLHDFKGIQKQFPDAKIISSTFDEFASELGKVPEEQLPSFTTEIADTWIEGVASDPLKLMQMRAMYRLRTQCIASGVKGCSLDDDVAFQDFSRWALKNQEHTWGLDVKLTITPKKHLHSKWGNKAFHVDMKGKQLVKLADSWRRQRKWGIDNALATLSKQHPLLQRIKKEFAAMLPHPPVMTNQRYTPKTLPGIFKLGRYQVIVNPESGALQSLVDTKTGINWLGGYKGKKTTTTISSDGDGDGNGDGDDIGFGTLEYQSYNAADYKRFELAYNYAGPFYSHVDYDDQSKVGIDKHGGAKHRIVRGALKEVFTTTVKHDSAMSEGAAREQGVCALDCTSGCTVMKIHTTMAKEVVELVGAAPDTWLILTIPATSACWHMSLTTYNKTSTRLPESMYMRFQPLPTRVKDDDDANVDTTTPATATAVKWTMFKLDQPVDPTDVIKGGQHHNHVVSDGGVVAKMASASASVSASVAASVAVAVPQMRLQTPDAGLICFGSPSPFPTPTDKLTGLHEGVSVNLWNNIWGTNYIMWYPFNANEKDIQYRMSVTFE